MFELFVCCDISNNLFILSVIFGDAFCVANGVTVLILEILVLGGVLGLEGCVEFVGGR